MVSSHLNVLHADILLSQNLKQEKFIWLFKNILSLLRNCISYFLPFQELRHKLKSKSRLLHKLIAQPDDPSDTLIQCMQQSKFCLVQI